MVTNTSLLQYGDDYGNKRYYGRVPIDVLIPVACTINV